MKEQGSLEDAWRAWQNKPTVARVETAYREAVAVARQGPTLTQGEIVGDAYRLDRTLGDGGLCTTWLATHLPTDTEVVLKVLHPHLGARATIVKRFRAAVQHQEQVAERGVLPVRDAGGEWLGFAWAAVAAGSGPLVDALPTLDPTGRTQVLIDVATALHNAHSAGLTHGRLTPSNILVTPSGEAILTDFGLIPPNALDSSFAPPEAGAPSYRATVVADRYAYAMIVVWMQRGGDLPYWAARDPQRAVDEIDVSADLRAALERSLHWDPEERPDDFGDLLRTLRGDAASVRSLAERALQSERPDAALDHYRHLLAVTAGDPDVRVDLATALAASGRTRQAVDQLYAALRAPRLRDLERTLTSLRGLMDGTGEVAMLLHALESRAAEGFGQQDALYIEIARLKARLGEEGEEDAWREALEAHTRRDQARLCLWSLVELAAQREDDGALVAWGARLVPLLDDPGALCMRLGIVHQRMNDPQNALLWLERAQEAGQPSEEINERLQAIRGDRGDWPHVIELLSERARKEDTPAPLWREAARIARFAADDPHLAADLYGQRQDGVLDVEAALFLAQHARREGDEGAELARLSELDLAALDDDALPRATRVHTLARLATLQLEHRQLEDAALSIEALVSLQPFHVSGRWLQAMLAREQGTTAPEALSILCEVLPAGSPDWCDAMLESARQHWLHAERSTSYAVARAVLDQVPSDPAAAWALARSTMGPETEPPWLRGAPPGFSPQEALARLLDGLLDPDGPVPLGLPVPPDATPLERAAALVDHVVDHDAVQSLLEVMAANCPAAAEPIALVARAWRDGPDPAFPIRRATLWSPAARGMPPGREGHRHIVKRPDPRSPWTTPRYATLDLDALPVRADANLEPVPVVHPDAPRAVAPEAEGPPVLVIHPGDVRQDVIPLTFEAFASMGSGPSDDIHVDALPPGHCSLVPVGSDTYLVTSGAPVRIGPATREELRLTPGLHLDVNGVRMEVRDASEAIAPPMLDLADFEDDDPTAILPAEVDPRPVALFTTEHGQDYMLPLTDPTLLDGGHELRAEPDGWRLHRADGQSLLVVVGDHFELDHLRYTIRPIVAVTPAPAPRVESPTDAVPTLVVNDGTLLGRAVSLQSPRTTIGRGRDADIQVSSDHRVSRHHCAIEIRHDGAVLIVDGGSSNGTFVDGEQVVDERVLHAGEIIEVGDTTIEFRMGPPIEEEPPHAVKTSDPSPTLQLPPGHLARMSLSDGRHRLAVVNRALDPILRAFDEAIAVGAAATELQMLLAAAPARYQPLFEGVEAKSTGLPGLPVLYNVARLPHWEQRPLLNAGLMDLLERATHRCADRLDDEACEVMLRGVAQSNYRKHLRV